MDSGCEALATVMHTVVLRMRYANILVLPRHATSASPAMLAS